MKCAAVFALLALVGSARATTLDEALRLAVANNRQLANARLEAGKADDRLAALRTQRLPRVNVDAFSTESLNRLTFDFREGIFGTYPGIGPVPAADTKVTLARTLDNFAVLRVTQPLTQLRQIAIGTRMAGEQASMRRNDAADAELRVVAEVKRLYHSIEQTHAAMTAADSGITTLEEIEKTASRHLAEKTILRADLLDVHARLASARASRATLADAYTTELAQMSMLIGRPFDAPEAPLTVTVDDSIAAPARPDIAKAATAVKLAEDDVRLQRAKSVPDVSLVGAYIAPSTAGVLPKNIAAVTLVISYEPFTWGRRAAEMAEKQKTLEQARNAERDAREAAEIEIADAKRRVDTSRLAIAAREAERDAAAERLRVVRERFANDAALLKDVLGRQAAASEAESRLIAAKQDQLIALADYDRALGRR